MNKKCDQLNLSDEDCYYLERCLEQAEELDKNTGFKCSDLINKEKVTAFHASDDKAQDLKRGYIGGERSVYFGLNPAGLIDTIKGRRTKVGEEWIEKTDYGLYKTEVPINDLVLDHEPMTSSTFERNISEKPYPIDHAAHKTIEKVLKGGFENRIPLREGVCLCVAQGPEKFLKENWLVHKEGSRVPITQENVIL